MSELKRALRDLHNFSRDASWISGRLGRLNSGGGYTIRVQGKPGWVHVRKGADGKQGDEIALNRGVPLHPNLRIRMLRENGILVIYGDDFMGGGNEQTGGGTGTGVAPHAPTHDRLGPDPLYIRGLAFLPLAARPTSPPSMAITVERAFYRYDGEVEAWLTDNSTSLSAYIPSSGVQHFVVVSLDRSSGALVITDGNSVASNASTAPFTPTEVLSIVRTLPDAHWPIAAVRLYGGQARITSADIFMDLRLWGGDTASSAAASSSIDGLLYSQTVDATVADTTTETSLLSAGRGSKILPADALEVGTAVRLQLVGHLSNTGNPTLDIKVKVGGTEVCSTGAQNLNTTVTQADWRADVLITCHATGASGTVVAGGLFEHDDGTHFGMVKTTTTTVDTTDELAIDVTATWGTDNAANTITCQQVTIELLGVDGLAPVGPTELAAQEI